MKKAFVLIVVILFVMTALAACSGGTEEPQSPEGAKSEAPAGVSEQLAVEKSEAPGTAAVIEPEQLISKEEAALLVGAVKDGEKSEQPAVGQKIVYYDTQDEEDFLQISLTQQAFMSAKGSTPESIYIDTKDAVSSENPETAEGVGSEYFFGTPGLHILYKGYYIRVAAGNSDDPEVREILKQAGAKAVANLDALLG